MLSGVHVIILCVLSFFLGVLTFEVILIYRVRKIKREMSALVFTLLEFYKETKKDKDGNDT